jgi:hypothetical protein
VIFTGKTPWVADNLSRNIYYQNPDLFKSQSAVDDMVDNLAFTLGVGREDLNIVGAWILLEICVWSVRLISCSRSLQPKALFQGRLT